MSSTGETRRAAGHVRPGVSPAARNLLLLSFAFLIVQTSLTAYGTGNEGQGVGWAAFGALMLWIVYRRRSRLAWAVVAITSLFGGVLYGLGALFDLDAAVLAIAFVGQAVPLLLRPVRDHVRRTGVAVED